LAEKIIPATDLSEQISLAGTEASGTGNMKFALNGALTIGTMDGANIEIHDAVGQENIFIFGMKVNEVLALREKGYSPLEFIDRSAKLHRVMELIRKGHFVNGDNIFLDAVIENLKADHYMVCADFDSYYERQQDVSRTYLRHGEWTRKTIFNIANMGRFSSDRTIREYADGIWNVKSVPVPISGS